MLALLIQSTPTIPNHGILLAIFSMLTLLSSRKFLKNKIKKKIKKENMSTTGIAILCLLSGLIFVYLLILVTFKE